MTAPPRPGEALARFWLARGERVVEFAGVLWHEYRRPFLQSLPYERRLDLDPEALDAALRTRRLGGVRYPTVSQPGRPSGLFLCETRGFSLERVEKRHRRQVQKGLERCEIRAVDPDELLAAGPALNRETMARQGRFDRDFGEPERFRRVVAAIRDCPEVTVPGAFIDGRLSAYAILCRDGAWQHLLFKMTRTADMIHRTNPALDFAILEAASRDPSLDGVTNSGLSFIRGSEGLHQYKQLMGYRIEPHDVAVRVHPAVAPVLTAAPVVSLARALARARPRSTRLELLALVADSARRTRRGDGGARAGLRHAGESAAAAGGPE